MYRVSVALHPKNGIKMERPPPDFWKNCQSYFIYIFSTKSCVRHINIPHRQYVNAKHEFLTPSNTRQKYTPKDKQHNPPLRSLLGKPMTTVSKTDNNRQYQTTFDNIRQHPTTSPHKVTSTKDDHHRKSRRCKKRPTSENNHAPRY